MYFFAARKLQLGLSAQSSCGLKRIAHITQINLNTRGDPSRDVSLSLCFSLRLCSVLVYWTSQRDGNNDTAQSTWLPRSCSGSSQCFIIQFLNFLAEMLDFFFFLIFFGVEEHLKEKNKNPPERLPY